jgi:hypothetical protein
MPDAKISNFTALTVRPDANDLLPIVDVSDTSQNASGTTKKISFANAVTNVIASDIAGKSDIGHTHIISDVTNLQSSLNEITTKTNNLTVPSAVNTDTLKSDILSANTKTNFLTVTANTNLDTIRTDVTTLKTYSRSGVVTVTTNASLNSTKVLHLIDSSSDITVTLPNANAMPDSTFLNIKRIGTGNVIVNPASGNNIDGTTTPYNFNTDSAVQFSSRRFITNGNNDWYLI